MNRRKLFLHTDAHLAFVLLILYAECNEFRALSRACGLTELTVAFLRNIRCSYACSSFCSFPRLRPFTLLCLPRSVSTALYTKTIKLQVASFNL